MKTNMIKVMHIITTLGPAGAENMLCQIAAGMDGTRFESEVVSLTEIMDLAERMESIGVRVRTLGMKKAIPNPLLVMRLAQWIRESKPDVIHTWMYHANLIGALAAQLAGNVPVVWAIHHNAHDPRVDKRRTMLVNRACALLSRKFANRIVFCSEASLRTHKELNYAPENLQVIPNGFDLDQVKPESGARESLRQELGIPADAILIGFAARFHPHKDHRNFILAAERLHKLMPEVHFLLFGMGITWDNSQLSGWIESAGIRERCHLLGLRHDIARLFSGIDIATTASRSEAFPIVIGEAMACGTPCVVTNVGDSALIVGNTGSIVAPEDPHALAEAWRALIDAGPAVRRRLGIAARDRVQRHFALPAVIESYQKIYAQAAVRPHREASSAEALHVKRKIQAGSQHRKAISNRPRLVIAVNSSIALGFLQGQPEYFQNSGFDVTVLCPEKRSGEWDVERPENVQILQVPMEREIAPLRDIRSTWQLWRVLRSLRPTVTNVGTPKAGLLGGFAAWLTRVPCRFYTLHGLRFETTSGFRRKLLTIAERVACRFAHRVVCVSHSVRRRAIAFGLVEREKAVVFGAGSCNGVDVARYEPTPERNRKAAELRARFGIPLDAPVVLFVGRVTRDKGICELLEAFRQIEDRFPQLRLLLVGGYEDGDPLPPEIREQLESHERVILAGPVNDPAPHYALADILVLPSHREGLPTVILEGQAAGKPVIGAAATGIVDLLVDRETGLLFPIGDSTALAEAIGRLLEDKVLAGKLAFAGQEQVKRKFRQELIWGALRREYLKVLQGVEAPRARVQPQHENQPPQIANS